MSRILLVDDDPALLLVLERALVARGHEVIGLGSGEAALTFLDTRRPDLLITDIGMAEMDGVGLMIEARERWPSLPVIVISGAGPMLLTDAQTLGARHALPKPIDLPCFLDRVAETLQPDRPAPQPQGSVPE